MVDRVDDRGQLRENVAKFSTYELAEKFLIWQWSSAARNALHLAGLGPELYARGIDSSVEAVEVSTGLRTPTQGRKCRIDGAVSHDLQSSHVEIRGRDRSDGQGRNDGVVEPMLGEGSSIAAVHLAVRSCEMI